MRTSASRECGADSRTIERRVTDHIERRRMNACADVKPEVLIGGKFGSFFVERDELGKGNAIVPVE